MKIIIEAIKEKLQAQKDALYFKDLQIQELKDRVENAEKEIERLKGATK